MGTPTRRISERRMPKRHVISVFRNLYDKSPLHLKKEFFRLFGKKDKKKLRYNRVFNQTGFARSVLAHDGLARADFIGGASRYFGDGVLARNKQVFAKKEGLIFLLRSKKTSLSQKAKGLCWRREQDLNLRRCYPCTLSKRVP